MTSFFSLEQKIQQYRWITDANYQTNRQIR